MAARLGTYIATVLMLACCFTTTAQNKKNMSKETVRHFAEAINAHNADAIAALTTADHVFVDASGTEVTGTEKLTAMWKNYFTSFPDYHIDLSEILVDGNTIAAFGTASGSYQGQKEKHWQSPASWKAVVKDGKISRWQMYTDPKAETMSSSSGPSAPGVTGLGGVFFKSKDPKVLNEWYRTHLHIDIGQYGANFEWRLGNDPSKYGATAWNLFKESTTYFAPSTKEFMINYRVDHLEQLVEQLRKDGITIVDNLESHDYGKFIHIMDPEGNKIELWEPTVENYDDKVNHK